MPHFMMQRAQRSSADARAHLSVEKKNWRETKMVGVVLFELFFSFWLAESVMQICIFGLFPIQTLNLPSILLHLDTLILKFFPS